MAYFYVMMEYIVNSSNREYEINFKDKTGTRCTINGEEVILDVEDTKTGFHILYNGKGVNVDVIEVNKIEKKVVLRINSKRYSFDIKDRFDDLLEKLGLNFSGAGEITEVKAPMPGLVLDVMIEANQDVKLDQPLLILEAMKMENVIKSPTEGSIKKIAVSKGEGVEKNQILVEFN